MDSAEAKLKRAERHFDDLVELIQATPPFVYVARTSWTAGKRYVFSRRDENAIQQTALLCGDIVHNLRSALDHMFWERVAPSAKSDTERRRIQFPFCDDTNALEAWIKRQPPLDTLPAIADAVRSIRPYRESSGNQMLCEVHDLDIADKHKLLIPLTEVKIVHTDKLRAEVSDFPAKIRAPITLGANQYDFIWDIPHGVTPMQVALADQVLNIPVMPFIASRVGGSGPIVPTIDRLIWVTRAAVDTLRSA